MCEIKELSGISSHPQLKRYITDSHQYPYMGKQ